MASLYVGNLDPECTVASLYQKFAPFGKLLTIRLFTNSKNRCRGHAFVYYDSKIDAQLALSKLNYSNLKDRPMRIMWMDRDIKKLPINANIFLKNLDSRIDERTLHDIFANYGSILSLKLARNEDGSSKGFGFIQFQGEKSAQEAIENVNGKLLQGKVVLVTKFVPQDKRLASDLLPFKNVYIKNLNSSLCDEDLVSICRKYGDINSAKVMLDEKGNSKCFGFVSFKSPDSAKEAIKELHGKILDGKRLFAGRAKKKAERQRELMENFRREVESLEKRYPQSI